MSAATMNGSDGIKSPATNSAAASKSQSRAGNNAKALDGARKQAASPVNGQSRKQQTAQPKAWQGPNPITQRASSGLSNGTEKPLLRLPSQAQSKNVTDSHADRHAHDRLLYIMANFKGLDATLTLKNGEQYTGVFSGGSFDSPTKNQYTLKMAKRTRSPNDQQTNGVTDMLQEYVGEGEDHVMTFDVQDTVDLAVADVVTTTTQPTQNGSISNPFRTDTEISGRDPHMPRQRELQRWDAGADSSIDMSLEADSSDAGWDQFAANQRLYGVESTYDENIYTTAINRDDPAYRRREAQAARIAREIEGSAPSNAHVAEERRTDADQDNGMDEEDKYSGVQREAGTVLPRRSAGSYVPPSQRPLTNAPTVRGAPFDPAIISLEKPMQALNGPAAAVTGIATDFVPPIKAPENAQPKPSIPEQAIVEPVAPAQVPAAAASVPRKPEQTIEEHVKSTADAFKQFANIEKLRSRQMQEAKRLSVRHEKNVKLNDLKKFAANFKLNSRVPDDLVPILAKDREKQLEIQQKAEDAAKEHEVKGDDKKKEKTPTVTSPVASSSAAQPAAAAPTDRSPAFAQQNRNRLSQQQQQQQMRNQLPQGQSPRAPLSQRMQQGNQAYGRGGIPAPQPLPSDLRIPSGPALQQTDRAPLSPTSATRLNVNAFEFRPAASTFTPSGTSPSPQQMDSVPAPEATTSFFGKDKKKMDPANLKEIDDAFNPIKRIASEQTDDGKKKSIPPPFKTPPTWEMPQANANVSYKDSFPRHQPPPSHTPSPMHTPNPNGPMPPHHHQLPPHMHGQPMQNPSQRPPFYQQPSHGQHPPFDPRMQFGPNGSVQSSPRFAQPQMAFGGQMGQMPMGMPQFGGQQMQMPYGTSPSMQYRQMNMPPGGPMMMPGQQHPQMPQMRPNFPQPPFNGPQMGGVPMMQQGSAGGGYMNGHPMPPPQQQPYSPMPPHAQPHMPPHMPPSGYSSSPRPAGPPMMQHQGSHQGYQPHMQQQPPQFAPTPAQPHPFHLQHQQRQLSSQGGGFPPHMTPRQGQAVPLHPSPGMQGGAGVGDEGK